jgi:hypothetical protein
MPAGVLSPTPWLQFIDANGNPYVAGKLYVFEAGTATPATVYQDAAQTVPHAHPIILDGAGRCTIYLPPTGAYIYQLKTSADVLVEDTEPVQNLLPFSGTYTPTLTNGTNVAASVSSVFSYARVGSMVTVVGSVNIDPTATGTLTELGISLPIASNFSQAGDGSGSIAQTTGAAAFAQGGLMADTVNDRMSCIFSPTSAASQGYSVHFTYRII